MSNQNPKTIFITGRLAMTNSMCGSQPQRPLV